MSYTQLLHTIPLFEALDEEDLEALAGRLEERRYAAGQMIINQGERGSEMYVVVSGDVNIHLTGEASRRISLKDIARGEYFGELALFDDEPRSASAVASTEAVVLVLARETLNRYLVERPRAAMALLRTMAERLRETNAMLSERAARNAIEEVERNRTWSERLADQVAEFNGSWAFIVGLVGVTAVWVVLNDAALTHFHVDPYPYVFYNLLLGILVALQGPLIMMSQNRQARKDRATAENDFKVNLKNEVNIETLLRELGELRAEMDMRLERLETHSGVGRDDMALAQAVAKSHKARGAP